MLYVVGQHDAGISVRWHRSKNSERFTILLRKIRERDFSHQRIRERRTECMFFVSRGWFCASTHAPRMQQRSSRRTTAAIRSTRLVQSEKFPAEI